jgi:hypothetical protein
MRITNDHVGTCVAYGPSPDAPVVRITSVSRGGYNPMIGVESSDGYSQPWISSMFADLDQITEDWRPATEEETARFTARYRPAPQNWN